MADFLIKAKPSALSAKPNLTTAESVRVAHSTAVGDVIEVRQDGRLGEYAHAGGKFLLLRVPDIDVKDAEKYMVSITCPSLIDISYPDEMIKRRKYMFDVAMLSTENKLTVDKEFVLNLTKDEFAKCLYNKDTQSIGL